MPFPLITMPYVHFYFSATTTYMYTYMQVPKYSHYVFLYTCVPLTSFCIAQLAVAIMPIMTRTALCCTAFNYCTDVLTSLACHTCSFCSIDLLARKANVNTTTLQLTSQSLLLSTRADRHEAGVLTIALALLLCTLLATTVTAAPTLALRMNFKC